MMVSLLENTLEKLLSTGNALAKKQQIMETTSGAGMPALIRDINAEDKLYDALLYILEHALVITREARASRQESESQGDGGWNGSSGNSSLRLKDVLESVLETVERRENQRIGKGRSGFIEQQVKHIAW
eukprot:TRINITY_DN93_c0_g1_i1.p1 TRINITY_DN93_c0_g1~~TRINITY_DN93_c0_g1_i1.p1  ORF type:complete len:129 (-),score=56.30 TRINITY_DN93_c0_g1_i1:207-593(-)